MKSGQNAGGQNAEYLTLVRALVHTHTYILTFTYTMTNCDI